MKERYSHYFLHNILEIEDTFATYYVQDRFFDREAIFGVQLKTFDDHDEAVEWIEDCWRHDDYFTIDRIRHFLAYEGNHHMVHLMEDYEVMDEVAWMIMDDNYPVVIHPVFEHPWQASNTIDTLIAIQSSASLKNMAECAALSDATSKMSAAVDRGKKTQGEKTTKKAGTKVKQAVTRANLIPHTQNDWGQPSTISVQKVLINAISIMTTENPGIVNAHPLDKLIAEAVNDFTTKTNGPWPTPVESEVLLADHMKQWVQRHETQLVRPAKPAMAVTERPKPKKRPKIIDVPKKKEKTQWIEVHLVEEDGTPITNEPFIITDASGEQYKGVTDDKGFARIDGIKPGPCKVSYVGIDGNTWK